MNNIPINALLVITIALITVGKVHHIVIQAMEASHWAVIQLTTGFSFQSSHQLYDQLHEQSIFYSSKNLHHGCDCTSLVFITNH